MQRRNNTPLCSSFFRNNGGKHNKTIQSNPKTAPMNLPFPPEKKTFSPVNAYKKAPKPGFFAGFLD